MPSNPICPPVASADMIRVQRMFENRERMHKAILRLQPRETFLVRKSQMESCRFCAFAKACAWRIPGGKLFFPCVGRLLKRGLFAADSKQRILVILVTCSKLFASHFAPLPSIRSFNNFEGCALRAAAGGRAVAVPYFAPPR